MNSPRFPPVDRSSSSDSKNNIYNQLRPHHIDDRNYYESQSISRASASKQILPPLESSERKQTKSITSKNGNNDDNNGNVLHFQKDLITFKYIILISFIFLFFFSTCFHCRKSSKWYSYSNKTEAYVSKINVFFI